MRREQELLRQAPVNPGENMARGGLATDNRPGIPDMSTGQVDAIFGEMVGAKPIVLQLFDPGPRVGNEWLENEIKEFEKQFLVPDSPEAESQARVRRRKHATTPKQERRLKKNANRMASAALKAAQRAAEKIDAAIKPVEEVQPGNADYKNGEYRFAGGEVITEPHPERQERESVSEKARKVRDGMIPAWRRVMERFPNDYVPGPLTRRQRAASVLTTVASGAFALAAPFAAEKIDSANAAKPSNRPAAIQAQAFGTSGEGLGSEKPFVQQRGKLEYPANLGKENELGYVQLPENDALYRFLTLQDQGEFGPGNGETCPAQRYGTKDLIGVINTAALSWHAAHPDIRLMIGDENADGHLSHRNGVDFDMYIDDDSLRIGSPQYNKDHAIELGKILLETGNIKIMFFNDPDVIVALNKYALANNLSGSVEAAEGHDAHFHVRITGEPGKDSAPTCDNEHMTVDIPWLPDTIAVWKDKIVEESKKYGINPDFPTIIMMLESGGNPLIGSPVGAQGLLQLMPDTAAQIAKEMGIKSYDLHNGNDNITLGVYYLAQQLKTFGDPSQGPSWDESIRLAAAAYNGGPGAADNMRKGIYTKSAGPFDETIYYSGKAVEMWQNRNVKGYDQYGGQSLIKIARPVLVKMGLLAA